VSSLSETVQNLHNAYTSGEYFQAELCVKDALLKWPEDTNLLQLGALTALAIHQVVTAHQRVDAAVDKMSMTAELANIKGRVHKASGDWAAAEAAYDLSQNLDPGFDRARINRLNLFSTSDQPKRVLEELETGFDYGEMGEVARSQALTDLGRYSEALEVLRALTSKTYEDEIIFQRIKCFAASEQLDQMLIAFEALSPVSALRAQALTVVVNAHAMRGQKEQSVDLIQGALNAESRHPNSRAVEVQSIRLLRRIGDQGTADVELKKLAALYPNNSEILSELADQARLEKQFEKSCELHQKALSANPGNFQMMCDFAQAAISAKRFVEAQTILQGALAQSPNNQFLLAMVSTLLREMGQDHTQLYDYEKFVRAYDIIPPEGYSDMTVFNAALSTRLADLHVYKDEPLNQSLRSGTQTETDLSQIDDPVLTAFFKAVDAPIRDYMARLGWDASHPLRRRNTNKYRIRWDG
jgi:Flp pilus assembly protein TadD